MLQQWWFVEGTLKMVGFEGRVSGLLLSYFYCNFLKGQPEASALWGECFVRRRIGFFLFFFI